MSIRKLFYLLLFSMGLISCSKDSKPTEPVVKFKLAVSHDQGVTGNIQPGIHEYPAGEHVQYSFAMREGYRNLAVQLGNGPAKPSGAIVMDGDKALFATADSIIVLPIQAEPIKTDVIRVMVAKDAAAAATAYEAYRVNLNALYQANPAQAFALASAASQKAFEETPDATWQNAQELLSGKLYGPTGSTSASAVASPIRSSLIYVNGVRTSIEDPAIVRSELERIVAAGKLAGTVEVYNFYNSGPINDPNQLCISRALILGSWFNLNSCGVNDSARLNSQIQAILASGGGVLETHAKSLAKIILQERAQGRRVLLVGHSQGTMLAAQALSKVENDGCLAGNSIGGIFGKASWPTYDLALVSGFSVAGSKVRDIALTFGQNDFATFPSGLTREADKRIAESERINGSYVTNIKTFLENWALHGIVTSYLSDSESRSTIAGGLELALTKLHEKGYCSIASNLRVYASDGVLDSEGKAIAPSNLWTVNPRAAGADTLVGEIRTASGTSLAILDIAESPATGELLGVTFDALYSINKATGTATLVKKFSQLLHGLTNVNALSFDSKDRVYAGSKDKNVFFSFDRKSLADPRTWTYPAGFISAGDLAYSPSGYIYATGEDSKGVNYLIRFQGTNPMGPGEPCNEPVGFPNVWGLSFVGNMLFGFTTDMFTGKGSLISIDLQTCKGTLVRKLGFNAFGAGRKSGKF